MRPFLHCGVTQAQSFSTIRAKLQQQIQTHLQANPKFLTRTKHATPPVLLGGIFSWFSDQDSTSNAPEQFPNTALSPPDLITTSEPITAIQQQSLPEFSPSQQLTSPTQLNQLQPIDVPTYDVSLIPPSMIPVSEASSMQPTFKNDIVISDFHEFKSFLPPSQRRAFEVILEYDALADESDILRYGPNGYRQFDIHSRTSTDTENDKSEKPLLLKNKFANESSMDNFSNSSNNQHLDTFGYTLDDMVTDVEEFQDYYDAKSKQKQREREHEHVNDPLSVDYRSNDLFAFDGYKKQYQKQRRHVRYMQYEKRNIFGRRIDNRPSTVRSRFREGRVNDKWDAVGRRSGYENSDYNPLLDKESLELYELLEDHQKEEFLDMELDYRNRLKKSREIRDELETLDLGNIDWLDPKASDIKLMLKLIESELQISFDELKRHVPLIELEEYLREKISSYQWHVIEANQESQRLTLMELVQDTIDQGQVEELWDDYYQQTETNPIKGYIPPTIHFSPPKSQKLENQDHTDTSNSDTNNDDTDVEIPKHVKPLRRPIRDLSTHNWISQFDEATENFLNHAMHIITSSYFGPESTQAESQHYSIDLCDYFESHRVADLQREENSFHRTRGRAVKQLQHLQDEYNELVIAKKSFDVAIIQNVETRLQVKNDFRNYCKDKGIIIYSDPELDTLDIDSLVDEKMKYINRIHELLLELDGSDIDDEYGLEDYDLDSNKQGDNVYNDQDGEHVEETPQQIAQRQEREKNRVLQEEFDFLVQKLENMDYIDGTGLNFTNQLLEEKGYVLPSQRDPDAPSEPFPTELQISPQDIIKTRHLAHELEHGKRLNVAQNAKKMDPKILGANGIYIHQGLDKILVPGKSLNDLNLAELVAYKEARELYEKQLEECEQKTKMFFNDMNAFDFQFNNNTVQQEQLLKRIMIVDDRYEDYLDSLYIDEKALIQLDLANSLFFFDLQTYRDCKKVLIASDILDPASDEEKSQEELQIDKDFIDFIYAPQGDNIFYYDEARNTLKRLSRSEFAMIKLRPDPRDSTQNAYKILRRTAFLNQSGLLNASNTSKKSSATIPVKKSPLKVLNEITDEKESILRTTFDDVEKQVKTFLTASIPELLLRWNGGDKTLSEQEYLLIKDYVLNPHRHDAEHTNFIGLDILDSENYLNRPQNFTSDFGLTAYEAYSDAFDEFRLKWLEHSPSDEQDSTAFFDLIREDNYSPDEISQFLEDEEKQYLIDKERRRKTGRSYDVKLGKNLAITTDTAKNEILKPLLLQPPESWYNSQGLPLYTDDPINSTSINNLNSPNRAKNTLTTFQQYNRFVDSQDVFEYDSSFDGIFCIPIGFHEALLTSTGKDCELTQPYVPTYFGFDSYVDHHFIQKNSDMISPSAAITQRALFSQLQTVPQY